MKRLLTTTLVLSVTLLTVGCDDATGPGAPGSSSVEVRFATGLPSQSSLPGASLALGAAGDTLVVEGSNGTLVITDIRMVVDEFELEGEGMSCPLEDDPDEDDDGEVERECKFESGSFFLDLPLDAGSVPVAEDLIPQGTYDELEFEVEDVELEEDEEDEGDLSLLAAEIRSQFPDWPSRASVMVEGRFLPSQGEAQPFRTFFDAEIEVEMPVDPPLTVDADGPDRTLTVEVRPERWFQRIDGSVINLALLDYETTGQVVEFEVEFENGFVEIEHDEHDD